MGGQIRRIAKFMDVPLDESLLGIVESKSSFSFMEAHQNQFDEHIVFEKTREKMGIPNDYVFADLSITKVRKGGGTTGEGRALPPRVAKMLEVRWETSVRSKTGLESY